MQRDLNVELGLEEAEVEGEPEVEIAELQLEDKPTSPLPLSPEVDNSLPGSSQLNPENLDLANEECVTSHPTNEDECQEQSVMREESQVTHCGSSDEFDDSKYHFLCYFKMGR